MHFSINSGHSFLVMEIYAYMGWDLGVPMPIVEFNICGTARHDVFRWPSDLVRLPLWYAIFNNNRLL